MEDNNKDIKRLANEYYDKITSIDLPEMKVDDLLDLIDYYSRNGMDFEAELYKRIAASKYPNHPDVILMCAHWEADEGNWNGVHNICSFIDCSKYDEALFQIEKLLRMMLPNDAYQKVEAVLSPIHESNDDDFLFDSAELFRDFGYMNFALSCLKQIPKSYPDYQQILELAAECYFYQTDFDASILSLDKAIDSNPFDDYLWAQTAMLQYKKGNYDQAMEACEYALAIQKDNIRAEHVKGILKWEKQKEYDVTASSYLRQDYSSMMEIGDLHYLKGDYKNAEAQFMAAGYFCPRSNRDHVQITFKTACCRIMQGRAAEGVTTFLSSIHQGFDLWPFAFELLQILLKEGHYEPISQLLSPIMRLDRQPLHRFEQLLTELTAFNCYKEAKDIWEIIIQEEDRFVQIYKDMIEEAKRKIYSDNQ